MKDVFGTDGVNSDGSTAAPPPAGPALPPPAAATAAAAQPTLQQAVDKAVAKAQADAAVATDPNAVHAVKLAATAPIVLGSTGAGAGIGFLLGGPPGAAIGAGVGWVAERYQIGGGPFGKVWNKIKNKLHKGTAAAPATTASK